MCILLFFLLEQENIPFSVRAFDFSDITYMQHTWSFPAYEFMNTCKENHLKVCQFCDLTKASPNIFRIDKKGNSQMQKMLRRLDGTNEKFRSMKIL